MFTQALSKFIANSSYKDLPEVVIKMAKRGATDFIAVALAGSMEPVGDNIVRFIKAFSSTDRCTVIGKEIKANFNLAALANGTIGHALDYDDVIHVPPMWLGHPSTVVLPAILAIGEKEGISGRDFLLAYALGIEVYVKVALFCGDYAYQNGWHNTSVMGTMAAAAAAAKVLKLNEHEVKMALGIAASLAGGIRQNFGTMTKPLHAGLAAQNGVEAAFFAKTGFTADEKILEAPLGFRNVFSHRYIQPEHDIIYGEEILSQEELANRLGNPWNIASPGLSFKICPSCRATHFGMEAALKFREAYPSELDQVLEIECHVPDHMESVLFHHNPAKGLEGKFSLEYVLARALIDGIPKIGDFTDSRVNEPDVKALINKIKLKFFQPQTGTFGVPVYIFKMKDGATFRAAVEFPRGEPENPVKDETIVEKFRDCARAVLSAGGVARIERLIANLEDIDKISQLTELLRI